MPVAMSGVPNFPGRRRAGLHGLIARRGCWGWRIIGHREEYSYRSHNKGGDKQIQVTHLGAGLRVGSPAAVFILFPTAAGAGLIAAGFY